MDIDISIHFDLMQRSLEFIDKDSKEFYIYSFGNEHLITLNYNENILYILKHSGLTKKEYIDSAIQYGATVDRSEIYFNTLEKAEKFKEWLDGMAILKTLRGNN